MKLKRLVPLAIATFALVITFALFFTFLTRETAWFGWLGLPDPSRPVEVLVGKHVWEHVPVVGWAVGVLISCLLFLGTYTAFIVFVKNVLGQSDALDDARAAWVGCRDEVQNGAMTPSMTLQALSQSIPQGSRLRNVLQIWSHDDPSADASLHLAAQAARPRHTLGLLATLANTLVLLGLVGNFFGLAEAVRQLPGLHRSQMAGVEIEVPVSAEPALQTQHEVVMVNGTPVKKTTTRRVSLAPSANQARRRSAIEAGGYLDMISAALGVVVCSSVLGILSMALLITYVSSVRSMLDRDVSDETAFLECEVAPLLRGQDDPLRRSLETTASALSTLPAHVNEVKVATDRMAAAVENSQESSARMLAQFETLFAESQRAFEGYSQSEREFLKQLELDRDAQKTLAESTTAAQATLAESVRASHASSERLVTALHESMRESSAVHAAYEQAHREYLEKVEAFEARVNAFSSEFAARVQETTVTMLDVLREEMKATQQGFTRTIDSTGQTCERAIQNGFARFEKTLAGMSETHVERLNESTDRLAALGAQASEAMLVRFHDAAEAFDATLQATSEQLRKGLEVLERQSDRALTLNIEAFDAARTSSDGARAALDAVLTRFTEVYDRARASFDLAVDELLASHRESLGQLARENREVMAEQRKDARAWAGQMGDVVRELRQQQSDMATVGSQMKAAADEARLNFVTIHDRATQSFSVITADLLDQQRLHGGSLLETHEKALAELGRQTTETFTALADTLKRLETRGADDDVRREQVANRLSATHRQLVEQAQNTMSDLTAQFSQTVEQASQAMRHRIDAMTTTLDGSLAEARRANAAQAGEIAGLVKRAAADFEAAQQLLVASLNALRKTEDREAQTGKDSVAVMKETRDAIHKIGASIDEMRRIAEMAGRSPSDSGIFRRWWSKS